MSSQLSDENARRAYWTQSMNDAYDFMVAVADFPVTDCGEKLVSLVDAADEAGVEVAFSDRPHVGECPRLFYLREGLIGDFLSVAEAMNDIGWVLKVEDAFRTAQMQSGLARRPKTFETIVEQVTWELDGQTPEADLMRKRVGAVIAASPSLGAHMAGAALDISVLSRDDGSELDRGLPYLGISELTPMESPFISDEARDNRRKITDIFQQAGGFVTYPWEYWHYSKGDIFSEFLLGNEGPARYGPVDFNPETGEISPIENPTEPLVPPEDIAQRLAQTLAG